MNAFGWMLVMVPSLLSQMIRAKLTFWISANCAFYHDSISLCKRQLMLLIFYLWNVLKWIETNLEWMKHLATDRRRRNDPSLWDCETVWRLSMRTWDPPRHRAEASRWFHQCKDRYLLHLCTSFWANQCSIHVNNIIIMIHLEAGDDNLFKLYGSIILLDWL